MDFLSKCKTSLAFYYYYYYYFSIIDLPHLAVEDKRQETSGGDKLPHDLDKKSEKRETHTNPFRKKGRMTKREKRETSSSYFIHSLSADGHSVFQD